jgi:hypothetical protein
MRIFDTKIKALTIGIVMIAPGAFGADTCPPPPTAIDPSVKAGVSYDKKTSLYTYTYDVGNGSGAAIPLKFFSLLMKQQPTSVKRPDGWYTSFMNLEHMPFHVFWDSTKVPIQPGAHRTGFSFQSPQPPGMIRYGVEGKTGVPSSAPVPGSSDDEPTPNCPGWNFEGSRFETLVMGMTTGPTDPGTISVRIRVREEDGNHSCHPIDPTKPSGKVSVLVLSTKDFDASHIKIDSVKFGPGEATPLSSRLVPTGRENIASWEENEEWEKHVAALSTDRDRDRPYAHRHLLLTFDLAALEVQCGLDKALFLSGQTDTGEKIMGGASSRFVGCEVRKPGKRIHHAHKRHH